MHTHTPTCLYYLPAYLPKPIYLSYLHTSLISTHLPPLPTYLSYLHTSLTYIPPLPTHLPTGLPILLSYIPALPTHLLTNLPNLLTYIPPLSTHLPTCLSYLPTYLSYYLSMEAGEAFLTKVGPALPVSTREIGRIK